MIGALHCKNSFVCLYFFDLINVIIFQQIHECIFHNEKFTIHRYIDGCSVVDVVNDTSLYGTSALLIYTQRTQKYRSSSYVLLKMKMYISKHGSGDSALFVLLQRTQ